MFQKNKKQDEKPLLTKKQELENILKTPTKEETRTVRLVGKTGCGCGGATTDVERIVPFDSPLQDGDYIGWDVLDTDKIL